MERYENEQGMIFVKSHCKNNERFAETVGKLGLVYDQRSVPSDHMFGV